MSESESLNSSEESSEEEDLDSVSSSEQGTSGITDDVTAPLMTPERRVPDGAFYKHQ